MSDGHEADLRPIYLETLHAPASWWLMGAVLAAAVGWVFLVSTPTYVALVAVVLAGSAVGVGLFRYGSVIVKVTRDGLQAGPALLDFAHLGQVEALDAAATRAWLGPSANAHAFLMCRPYCHTAVRVEVRDRRDPTPYWLVSSRHADDLAAILQARSVRD